MDTQTRELLIRCITYIEIAQAMITQEAPALRARIMAELQAAEPKAQPANGPSA